MRTHKKLTILILLFYLFATVVPAFAQDAPPGPCAGQNVSGRVVAVDETTGVVTVELADGTLCTVTLAEGTYAHPIVALLGKYFDDLSAEALSTALAALRGCALLDADGITWTWVACSTEGSVPVTVTGVDETGAFTAIVDGTEEEITVLVGDPAAADDLLNNLETLLVNWQLDEFGAVIEAGDKIAAYHEEGIGFGVLVKLFAIALESQEACAAQGASDDPTCGVTVEELVAAMQNDGLGMGELFKLYGKPAMLGVGHVRKNAEGGKGKPEWAGPKDKDKNKEDDADENVNVAPDQQGPQDKDKKDKEEKGPPDHANGNRNQNKNKNKNKDKNGWRVGPPDHAGPSNGKGKP